MSFGVDDTGFTLKRLADVLDEAETELSGLTDPVSGNALAPEFNSDDPAMQIVKVPLEGVGKGWEGMQVVYEQFDPGKATGAALSALMQFSGITRDAGSPSTAPVDLVGTPNSALDAGQLISDEDETTVWEIPAVVNFDGSGNASAVAESVENGAFTAAIGTLTKILTPQSNWTSVTNTSAATPGTEPETNPEARRRRDNSTLAPASAPAEAIWANLRDLEGVTYTRVYANNTLATDSRGVNAKSVFAVVVGGDDTEIAKVLLARTGLDADWQGSTLVQLFDKQGEPYNVRFTRPTGVDIWIEIDTTVDQERGTWPSDGAQQIRDAIVAYAAGGPDAVGAEEGFNDAGFPPGVNVDVARLYTPANSVPGHNITRLEIGTSMGVVSTSPVVIAIDEVADFLATAARIVVNVT